MAKAESFAEERNLLEFLRRIERNQSAYSALYVYVSKLKPKNFYIFFILMYFKLLQNHTQFDIIKPLKTNTPYLAS